MSKFYPDRNRRPSHHHGARQHRSAPVRRQTAAEEKFL